MFSKALNELVDKNKKLGKMSLALARTPTYPEAVLPIVLPGLEHVIFQQSICRHQEPFFCLATSVT